MLGRVGHSSVMPYSMAAVPEQMWTDLPFIYAVDASKVNAQNLGYVTIPTDKDSSDFYLRRVFNIANTFGNGSSFRIVKPNGAWMSDQPIISQAEWVVAPEVKYKGGDDIRISVYNGTVPTNTDPQRFVGFQGVRRYTTRVNMRPTAPGNWRELPFQYVKEVDLGSFTTGNYPAGSVVVNDHIEIFNYDFELRRIMIVNASGAVAADADISGTPADGQALYYLQDAAGRGLSNIPIPDIFLSYNSSQVGSNCPLVSLFPVPGIIYPNGSNIKFQVSNGFIATGELTTRIIQQVIFDGVWRVPCA